MLPALEMESPPAIPPIGFGWLQNALAWLLNARLKMRGLSKIPYDFGNRRLLYFCDGLPTSVGKVSCFGPGWLF
jgi:hypothetical protein